MQMVKLRYGNTNTFLLRGDTANLLVDTDYAGTLPAFYKAIKQQGIAVQDITYVMTTHYHPDHMGIIGDLMEHGREFPEFVSTDEKTGCFVLAAS